MSADPRPIRLEAIKKRLEAKNGPHYWRSLEELSQSEEFLEEMRREFPEERSRLADPVTRRRFLQLMGAALALAGLTGCPENQRRDMLPYVNMPKEVIPGRALYFATAMPFLGHAFPVIVESHEGRPTKIEGNPAHPATLGATNIYMQASVLTLWDPERSQAAVNRGRLSAWSEFLSEARGAANARKPVKGEGIRLLSEPSSSPTFFYQMQQFFKEFPAAKWCQHDASGRDSALEGAQLALGQPLETHYALESADVIVSLDADLLLNLPGSLRYARDFSARRRLRDGQKQMNRLYVIESIPSVTGSTADHRLALSPSKIELFARALAQALGVTGAAAQEDEKGFSAPQQAWLKALTSDLQEHRGRSVVVPGPYQSPAVHALAHAMNERLANTGKTVIYTESLTAKPPANQSLTLRELADEMQAGKVEFLVIMDANPVYTAPAELQFANAMAKVPLRVHMGLYENETSVRCHWHLPQSHYLESWSDVQAFDGTVSIIQPLIAPLYVACRSPHELIAGLTGEVEQNAQDIVKNFWKTQHPAADFELWWRKALDQGFVEGTAAPAKQAKVQLDTSKLPPENKPAGEGLEVAFRPDPSIHDGRFANNAWLQELPKPWTKLSWDNAALLSPATAERLGVDTEQMVQLSHGQATLKIPAYVLPGMPDDTVGLFLGFGRSRVGKVGENVGVDVGVLRAGDNPWAAQGVQLTKLAGSYPLARTQGHQRLAGRPLLRTASLAEYEKNPNFVEEYEHKAPGEEPGQKHVGVGRQKQRTPAPDSLYPEYPYTGYAWGMVIDMSVCIGCNACVIACQSENNIPTVGKDQVGRGREMLWLRVDQYFKGSPEDPEVFNQPVPCMHCEKAPCELVCPVHATTHSPEGINEMTYNRCVGTRFCSNNCPYKVRRFNFYQYTDYHSETLKLRANPEVSVRERGVMEKCTYCVQRINNATIDAQRLGRPVKDGEILTACQAACPTQAIVFGDINDPGSRVAKYMALPLDYSMLEELNTQPRTTYLASVRNPNPQLEKALKG